MRGRRVEGEEGGEREKEEGEKGGGGRRGEGVRGGGREEREEGEEGVEGRCSSSLAVTLSEELVYESGDTQGPCGYPHSLIVLITVPSSLTEGRCPRRARALIGPTLPGPHSSMGTAVCLQVSG